MAMLASLFWTFVLLGSCHCYIDKTIYQYLVDNGYSLFVQLLKETGQDRILSGTVPVTVFAPDNAAMGRMDLNIKTSLDRNVWQKINLAKYHIVDDFVLVPFLHGQQSIMTTAGQKIALTFLGSSITLNNASHLLAASKDDIILNNGVIQPIDSVLIPPLYSPDNLFAILLERDDIFLDFPLALMLSNLSQLITHGEYTIFAPVDAAYAIYTDSILHPRGNVSRDVAAKIFYEMNKYHIVPGARGLDSLTHGQILYTLHGTPLNISVLTNGYMVNQARVIEGDIPASNGVVHAIDSVLFPADLLPSLGIDPASLSTARP